MLFNLIMLEYGINVSNHIIPSHMLKFHYLQRVMNSNIRENHHSLDIGNFILYYLDDGNIMEFM